jgi:hypothetical protein
MHGVGAAVEGCDDEMKVVCVVGGWMGRAVHRRRRLGASGVSCVALGSTSRHVRSYPPLSTQLDFATLVLPRYVEQN